MVESHSPHTKLVSTNGLGDGRGWACIIGGWWALDRIRPDGAAAAVVVGILVGTDEVAGTEVAGGGSRATMESVAGGWLSVVGGGTCSDAEHEAGGEEVCGCFVFEQ